MLKRLVKGGAPGMERKSSASIGVDVARTMSSKDIVYSRASRLVYQNICELVHSYKDSVAPFWSLKAPNEVHQYCSLWARQNWERLTYWVPIGYVEQLSGNMQCVASGVLRASDQYTLW
jgi:hypothetical protein